MTEEYVQRKPLKLHDTPDCYGKHDPKCNECKECYCEHECQMRAGLE